MAPAKPSRPSQGPVVQLERASMEGFVMETFSNGYIEREKKTSNSSGTKLEWLRSQIVGQNVEFTTPFGKRLLSYADHTASGRGLQFVENFIMEMALPVYGNTHTDDSFVGSITGNSVKEAQKYLKACMGGTDDDALLFCGSGSTAAIKKLQEVMGIYVPPILRGHMLATMKKEDRWVVFVGPYEHHSNLLSWRQTLAEVVEIPLNDAGLIDILSLKEALQSPVYQGRPKLGSFSACSNVTGILSATRDIARLLHAHKAFACFDFAACAPYVKIDMRSGDEDGYDAIFVSPHKFMGGPGTSGLLLMSQSLYLLKDSPPSSCGGGTVDFVNFDEEETLYYDDIEQREDAGTPAILQKIRTALVFCVKEFLTAELIASRESYFIEEAMSRLGSNPNIDIYGSSTAKRIAIMSFGIHPNLDLPTDIEFHREDEALGGLSPNRTSFVGLANHPHVQWMSKGSREGITCPTIRNMKSMSLFATKPSKESSLPLKETKASNEEPRPLPTKLGRRGKHLSGRFIVKLLNDLFGIQARGGCSCSATYGHRLLEVDTAQSLAFRGGIKASYGAVKPGWARISFGYYITHKEFEFILSAIEFTAEYGARFLPLYDLDWKTGDWTFKQDNQEVKDLISEAEQQFFGEQRKFMWSQGSRFSALGLFVSSNPVGSHSRSTDAYDSKLRAKYLKVAKYLADHLPLTGHAREFPRDLEPSLITFMT